MGFKISETLTPTLTDPFVHFFRVSIIYHLNSKLEQTTKVSSAKKVVCHLWKVPRNGRFSISCTEN